LSTAMYVSSIFLKRTLGQEPPPIPGQVPRPPDQGLAALPDAKLPPSMPPAMPPSNPPVDSAVPPLQAPITPPSVQDSVSPSQFPPSGPSTTLPRTETKPGSNTQPDGPLRTLLEG